MNNSIASFIFAVITLFRSADVPASVIPIESPNSSPAVTKSEEHLPEERKAIPIIFDESVTAHGVLLYNLETGEIIGERDKSLARPIASVTKIMTGLLALENLDSEMTLSVPEDAVTSIRGTSVFRTGDMFTLKDLLAAMMMDSSNDAAMTIADTIGAMRGGEDFTARIDLFVDLMNQRAQELGMGQTIFRNPTGLDVAQNYPSNLSTAEDMKKLIDATRSHPLLWESSRDPARVITSIAKKEFLLKNSNELADNIPHFIGGKTGTTDAAGESLILLFEKPLGSPCALILLGAEHGKRFSEARALLEQFSVMLF